MEQDSFFLPLEAQFYQSAYRQVVIMGKVEFPEHDEQIFTNLMRGLPNEAGTYIVKMLYELMGKQSFKWPLHEKCLNLCREHNVFPCRYRFYTREPNYPTTTLSGLEYLTVAEIKPLLKMKGLSVSGNRDELVSRIKDNISFDEIELIVMPKFKAKLDNHAKKYIFHQYELLVEMLNYRAHFLHRIQHLTTLLESRVYNYELEVRAKDEEEKTFVNLLTGKGYETIVKNNAINGLLPLFPSGTANVRAIRQKR